MQYKEEGHRQYFLYGCVRTDDVMRTKPKKSEDVNGDGEKPPL